MKNTAFMKKGFIIQAKEVHEIINHLETYGCTECSNKNIQILKWIPGIMYVNCPSCEIIYKFDFNEMKAERVDVSWNELLRIAAD